MVAQKHDELTRGKSWSKSFEEINEDYGEYLPVGMIVKRERGWSDVSMCYVIDSLLNRIGPHFFLFKNSA